jgi:hyperosmotically inducible periplasmic protein
VTTLSIRRVVTSAFFVGRLDNRWKVLNSEERRCSLSALVTQSPEVQESRTMKRPLVGLFLAILAGCGMDRPPASTSRPNQESPVTVTANRPVTTEEARVANGAVDRSNTGVNERDRDSAARTSFDQNENSRDIGITADIRKRVVDTKMSINAQNVKIITQNGKVTLRGPVETEDEKRTVEEFATAVAGSGNVVSQLEVSGR